MARQLEWGHGQVRSGIQEQDRWLGLGPGPGSGSGPGLGWDLKGSDRAELGPGAEP